jgi:hypothetical protein
METGHFEHLYLPEHNPAYKTTHFITLNFFLENTNIYISQDFMWLYVCILKILELNSHEELKPSITVVMSPHIIELPGHSQHFHHYKKHSLCQDTIFISNLLTEMSSSQRAHQQKHHVHRSLRIIVVKWAVTCDFRFLLQCTRVFALLSFHISI